MALRTPPRQERRGSANWGGCEVVWWSTGVRVPCTAAHAHVCMHTLRVACLPVLYVGSSRVTTGWRVILSASGWADLTSRVWRTQLRCDPKPRLWPGGFGTFRKRTDMSGDALGTRSLSTPLPNSQCPTTARLCRLARTRARAKRANTMFAHTACERQLASRHALIQKSSNESLNSMAG